MLESLKFCIGSIARKEFVSGLTHFTIENNTVRGYNGTISICAPIEFDIKCNPSAKKLIAAIANCEDTIKLVLTPTGKLSVRSGSFKALIECIEQPAPKVEPEGQFIQIDGEAFVKGLKAVSPFIGTDASRLWSHGVLFKDKSLFATNNVILVQYWIGIDFPCVVNIPEQAIKELLRIGEAPSYLQVAENSITFHFEKDRWLRTQLYSTEWPPLEIILDRPSQQKPINQDIFKALETLKPFVDSAIYFNPDVITTQLPGTDGGAEYEIEGLEADCAFKFDFFRMLEGNIETIDFSLYPDPVLFTNGIMRGAISGIRK